MEDASGSLQCFEVARFAEFVELKDFVGNLVLNGLEDTERSFHFALARNPLRCALIQRAGESDLPYAIECWIKLGKAGPSMVETPS